MKNEKYPCSTCIQLSLQSVHSGTQFHVEDLKSSSSTIAIDQLAIFNSPFFNNLLTTTDNQLITRTISYIIFQKSSPHSYL